MTRTQTTEADYWSTAGPGGFLPSIKGEGLGAPARDKVTRKTFYSFMHALTYPCCIAEFFNKCILSSVQSLRTGFPMILSDGFPLRGKNATQIGRMRHKARKRYSCCKGLFSLYISLSLNVADVMGEYISTSENVEME